MGRKFKRRTGDIFLHIRPEMQQKMKQPWHIRWTVMPMAVCFIRAFIRFLGAVVVCHFRVCNPIFHTLFLHHFGVE